MDNLVSFLIYFGAYLIQMGIIVVLCIIAGFIGIKMRKSKDAKAAAETASQSSENS